MSGSDVSQAIELMSVAMPTMLGVTLIFISLIKALIAIFPYKPEED